jgi:hypothetical protein
VADEASKLLAENATLRQAAENLVGDIAQTLAKKGVQPTRCEGPQPKPEKAPPPMIEDLRTEIERLQAVIMGVIAWLDPGWTSTITDEEQAQLLRRALEAK